MGNLRQSPAIPLPKIEKTTWKRYILLTDLISGLFANKMKTIMLEKICRELPKRLKFLSTVCCFLISKIFSCVFMETCVVFSSIGEAAVHCELKVSVRFIEVRM